MTEDATVLDERPANWDGFGFYRGEDGFDRFYFFDEMVRKYGPVPKDPAIPADREAYHVILTSARKGKIHIEEPFLAHFLDPFVYARHLMDAKFLGTMVRKTIYSEGVVDISLTAIREHHRKNYGYFYTTSAGGTSFFEGAKKR